MGEGFSPLVLRVMPPLRSLLKLDVAGSIPAARSTQLACNLSAREI